MNAGIELLLKRMETHPEEFFPIYDEHSNVVKFGGIVNAIMGWNGLGAYGTNYDFLSPEDIQAFKEGVQKIRADQFSADIFKKVMGAEDPKPQAQPSSSTVRVGTAGGGVTLGQLSSIGGAGTGTSLLGGAGLSGMSAQNAYNQALQQQYNQLAQQNQARNAYFGVQVEDEPEPKSGWEKFKDWLKK